jgi:hypothetical protein
MLLIIGIIKLYIKRHDLIDTIKNLRGCHFANSASDKLIENCMETLQEQDFPMLPNDYINFLKNINGFTWNGLEFFGSKDLEVNNIMIPNIVSANERYENLYPKLIGKLFVGKFDNDVFTFDYETNNYQMIDTTDCEELESFSSIEDLLKNLLNIK